MSQFIDCGQKCKTHLSILLFVFVFNLVCTYHTSSPPGSEQERLEYAVNSKRRALILALRWANAHTYLLQEEPAAVSFLEVMGKLSNALNYTIYPLTLCVI